MIRIFTEGKPDSDFINFLINYLISTGKITDCKIYEVINVGGYTKLNLVKNKFDENTDDDGLNLLIFDADSISNGGGFTKRTEYLNSKKTELSIEFELFLFPNNNQDGDLESVLENIVNSNHDEVLRCFENYESCIEGINSVIEYKTPIRKAKIYSYINAFPKSRSEEEEFKKGNFFYNNTEMWNFNSPYLQALETFLVMHLSQI